mgnify:FL=1
MPEVKVYLPYRLYAILAEVARDQRRTVQDLIRELVEEALAEKGLAVCVGDA